MIIKINYSGNAAIQVEAPHLLKHSAYYSENPRDLRYLANVILLTRKSKMMKETEREENNIC